MNLRSILRQPVLTIAFHPSGVRWTVGAHGRVSASGRVPLPAGSLSDGVVVQPDAVGRILREAPDFRGKGRMQVALALPAQRAVFRVLELPILKGKPFDELVSREIRREMPMMGENAYVAWKRLHDGDAAATVFVVGVARDIVDSHVAAARAARLHPQSADLRIIAAARAVGQSDCVIASVEDDEAEIAIFRDGMPSIVRHVDLAQGIDQAEWARQLAEELARTLKFYRDTHRDDELAGAMPITLVGDAAPRAMLAPEIRELTGRDVEMPPLRLILAPEQDTVGFAANVGLALKDIAA
jgi:Tfp pilus assembly PilM family ATPase